MWFIRKAAQHCVQWTGEAFSPDGKKLVSGSADTTIRLWDMDIQSWQEKACQRAGRNLTLAEWQSYYSESLPYEPTCPQWPIPQDAQAYLDRRALSQRQIVAGGIGLLAICILIWRRKTRKVKKE